MDELVIGDKTYISSKRAAEITGYAKDYVGQLCREGYVEAKMVGRSWYVLESSIRDHRFGSETPEVLKYAATATDDAPLSTWQPPVYAPEEPARIPELAPREETAPSVPAGLTAANTIADMQDAWREWFDTRQAATLDEIEEETPNEDEDEEAVVEEAEEVEPELGIAEENESESWNEEPVAIPVHKMATPAPEPSADVVPIRRQYQPRAAAFSMPVRPKSAPRQQRERSDRKGANVVTMALLVALGALVLIVGVVGSGFADAYMEDNVVLRYLGGTSTIYK
ncbi:MAG TPA: hypothetical protein VF696_02320 [Candidatus Paceibacterota bacterium]